jgi:tryptophan synthase alpha chain
MNYQEKFKELKAKNQKALIPFTVLGDPDIETSLEIIKAIINGGADILELGIAFSDPIADGPTIQSADIRALEKHIDTDKAFEMIKQIRAFTDIPVGLLVYYNLVLQRYPEKFYSDAKKAGVNGILIADMPVEEADNIVKIAKKTGIDTVFIVSPLTSDERLREITKNTTGFVYVVSRLGVTGARKDISQGTISLLKRIRPLTRLTLCVGFGISTADHVERLCKAGADGAIVGSAIVKLIEKNMNNKKRMLEDISKFVKELKQATR